MFELLSHVWLSSFVIHDALGGLPGSYNHYFDKQIGIEKFLKLFENEINRKARLEHCFAKN
jgi:inosine/xanthosine triphosphate pyrophosphatase family protein